MIVRYARAQGWSVDKWVTEVVSGKKEVNSRKLGRLLKTLKRCDTIMVTEVSRLSRSLTEIMGIMGVCVKKGTSHKIICQKFNVSKSKFHKYLGLCGPCFAT